MDDEVLVIRDQNIVVRPYILPHLSRMTAEEVKQLGGEGWPAASNRGFMSIAINDYLFGARGSA